MRLKHHGANINNMVKIQTLSLSDFLISHDLDILALAETWLGTDGDDFF